MAKRANEPPGKRSLPSPTPKFKQYIDGVLDGSIVVNKWVRLSVERHVRDIETAAERGLYFDLQAAARPIQFTELFLKHSKGKWAGKPVILEPWQHFILGSLFGWKRSDGTRRFRLSYCEVARKNGKSLLASAVGVYGLVADDEEGAEIYSAATTRDQAKIVFQEAQRMVKRSADLREIVEVYKNNISVPQTFSKFEALSSDGDTLDGLNVHMGIIDEVHAHKNREVFDVIDTATGARSQPLIFCITTAGLRSEGSIALELQRYAKQTLEQTIEDDNVFSFIAAIDDGDSYDDESCWPKANPNLGVSCSLEDLRGKCKRARESAAYRHNFLCKHLNVWVNSHTAWLPTELWEQSEIEINIQELYGRKCFAGLDLSSTTDVTAFALVFPPEEEGGEYIALQYYWVPKETAAERTKKAVVNFDAWMSEGHMEGTEGSAVDYELVYDRIKYCHEIFDVQEVAIDLWNAQGISNKMMAEGMTPMTFGQGYKSMSEPMKRMDALLRTRKIKNIKNPVSRWMFANVSAKMDPAGNIKPDKEKSTEKIDGIVATIMALGRAILATDPESVYEKKDPLSI